MDTLLEVATAPYRVAVKPAGDGLSPRMSRDVLEILTRQYLESQPACAVVFQWDCDDLAAVGLDFFREAVGLQQQFRNGKSIANTLTTTGAHLDDTWGNFLADHAFDVTLRIDGPEAIHEKCRAAGGAFADADRALRLCQRHGVSLSTVTAVSRANVGHPLEVYRFLRTAGVRRMHFEPVVAASDTGRGVQAEAFGDFLIRIFDEWSCHDADTVAVTLFDNTLAKWIGITDGGMCDFAKQCGRHLGVQADGAAYACPRSQDAEHRLGNIAAVPLASMVESPAQLAFGSRKSQLSSACRQCHYLFACGGGCPSERMPGNDSDVSGTNPLCAGLKAFFRHADPCLTAMAKMYRAGLPPAEIMGILRDDPAFFERRQKGGA